MPTTKKWVPVAKVIREWGIRGQVKCVSFNPESQLFSELKKIYPEGSEEKESLEIENAKPHGKYWLVKFSKFENPESARKIRGLVLTVPREDLPEAGSGEIYLTDLEGMVVQSSDGEPLGTIQGFQRVGDSDVMLVGETRKDTVMIPYQSEFVTETNQDQGFVRLTEFAKELL